MRTLAIAVLSLLGAAFLALFIVLVSGDREEK